MATSILASLRAGAMRAVTAYTGRTVSRAALAHPPRDDRTKKDLLALVGTGSASLAASTLPDVDIECRINDRKGMGVSMIISH